MTFGELLEIQRQSGLSPENLGTRLGLSGMTLRRWASLPPDESLPELYQAPVKELVYELLAEDKIQPDSVVVQKTLEDSRSSFFTAVIKSLGFSEDFMKTAKPDSESLVSGISQLGANNAKQESVDRSQKKILSYGKLGAEWKFRIRTLLNVTRSKNLNRFEKFAAYGALFYLISPFDLIPDHIPVFGLLDDFFILGIVALYYVDRFPKLFSKETQG